LCVVCGHFSFRAGSYGLSGWTMQKAWLVICISSLAAICHAMWQWNAHTAAFRLEVSNMYWYCPSLGSTAKSSAKFSLASVQYSNSSMDLGSRCSGGCMYSVYHVVTNQHTRLWSPPSAMRQSDMQSAVSRVHR